MKRKRHLTGPSAVLAFALALGLATVAHATTLRSPDGRIKVSITMPAPDSAESPRWSASFQGRPVLTDCRLGLQTREAGDLLAGGRLLQKQSRKVNDRIPVLFGRASHADDRFHEVRLVIEGRANEPVHVVFRCYNDAVALRYELPPGGDRSSVTITDETTAFNFSGNPAAYVQYLEHFKTSHEHNVTTTTFRDIKPGALLDLPLTLAWRDSTWVAITEAALRHYAGMALMRPAGTASDPSLVCQLTPRPDGTKVTGRLPLKTPWRVALLTDRPGALLESRTLYCLNEPSALPDTSWIQPGKLTWHWWNGDVYDGQRREPILSLGMARKYIDFCAQSGIPFHALTSTENETTPWYHQSRLGSVPGPDTDVIRPREGFDLPAIRSYAQSRNVRLWTWVHHSALRGRVDEAFAAFEKMGWSGMMVDYFDHDDQDTVEFTEEILRAAARHHMLIHFHGVWKPTGLERTYPNLMNHEGALNLEYLKWSTNCTPEHSLLLAFTRLVAGPMDYHLGGFRAVPPSSFTPRFVAPNVMGTRAHMLAMYVCFDNPSPMIADYPTAYAHQPGFDFLTLVPTWWDETRVLAAEIGELLVTARRKGDTWYLGGMSAKRPRDLSLPLNFLPSKRYTAKIWKDAPNTQVDPNLLEVETRQLDRRTPLQLKLATDGGFAAQLTPR